MIDSRPATHAHIRQVRDRLQDVIADLANRALVHDRSKLESPELEVLDEHTPANLHEITYGSEEYDRFRAAQGDFLSHHHAHNRHHPEYHEQGIQGMNLLDLLEMLADWKAATQRHADGDLDRSITVLRERYGYGEEMEELLRNTARDLGWL